MSRLASLAFSGLVLAGCAGAGDGDYVSAAPAPLVGVDGSRDQADRNCHVVLRDLARNWTGFTWETDGSSWVWQGSIELSEAAVAEGLVPSVMYRMAPSGAWSAVEATPLATEPHAGYLRYSVRLHAGLPGPGWSGTSLANARIEVVPFVALPEGGRLFDHNRHAGDLDNYLLRSPALEVGRDVTACAAPAGPMRANLVFAADFRERRVGELVPGGELAIVYDPARLPTCRNWRNGNPLYDLTAHVEFSPGGQRHDVSVRDGAPVLAVPGDARGVTLWFENTGLPGCQAWDSNLGANYHFDAAFGALVPPQWMGEARSLIARGASDPCDGGAGAAQGFAFDTWARQRATHANLCFEVYQPGVTDRDDPDLWQKLDVQLHYRYLGQTPGAWQTRYVGFERRRGNNAGYVAGWRELDPLQWARCPEVAPIIAGGYEQVGLEYYVTVNGGELRPAPGATFAGTFTDYPSAWRDANCD